MKKHGFTLIELLTVIAIIALLVGLLLPVVHRVRRYAWRARAREDVYQVVVAWKTYLNDYRRFPTEQVDIVEMDPAAIELLNFSTNIQMFILEFTADQTARGFRDPWDNLYQVALDRGQARDSTAYDGKVEPPHGEVGRSVVAWSRGPDGEDATEDDVTSWDWDSGG